MPMLNPILPLAYYTSHFTTRHLRSANKSVRASSRARELLKVRKVLHHNALFLASNGATPALFHQKQHSLPIFCLASMLSLLVRRKLAVAQETHFIAQLTHEGTRNDRLCCKAAQCVTFDITAWDIRSTAGKSSICFQHLLSVSLQTLCLCRCSVCQCFFCNALCVEQQYEAGSR